MEYASVCSGIEVPSVAWEPLGWSPTFFSEIETFPREVLKQRQRAADARLTGAAKRGVPLWADFTAIRMRFLRRLGIRLPDLLIGGTPCQPFSLAGLRQSLSDSRGNLTLEYVRLANAIDNERARCGRPGIVLVWENVPGVLSTEDNAFGCFLAGIVGADTPLVPPKSIRHRWRIGKKKGGERFVWTDAGMVAGPVRVAAWRVLDSQYFGLAQRRERVFLVAGPVDGIVDPAEVLLEQDGVRRDHPPIRGSRADVAGTLGGTSPGGGWRFGADEAAAGQLVAGSLKGSGAGADDNDARNGRLVAFGGNNTRGPIEIAAALNAHGGPAGRIDFESETFVAHTLRGEGFDASEDGSGRGVPLVPAVSTTLRARDGAKGVDSDATGTLIPFIFDPKGGGKQTTLGMSFDRVGALGTTKTPAVAFSCKDSGADASDEVAPTMRAMGHRESHANAGGQLAVASPSGQIGVRRLMPVECERLQGVPDDYTAIEFRGKPAADGPRYKALGNAMSVPPIAWIGRRIERAIKLREAAGHG